MNLRGRKNDLPAWLLEKAPKRKPGDYTPKGPTVFVVQHSYAIDKRSGEEDAKLIGVFATKGKAKSAIAALRKKPGFKRYPRKFSIDPYEVDQVCWQDGFFTETHA